MSEEKTGLLALIPESITEIVPSAFTEQDVEAIAKGGDYLPRLVIVGSNSDLFKNQQIQKIGVYALVYDKNRFRELGPSLNLLVLAMRPKALRLGDQILSYYNRQNPEFQKIMVESRTQNSGCLFGPEFLVWIPSIGEFALYFMGSWSARKESPNMLAVMKKGEKDGRSVYGPAAAALGIRLEKNKKGQSWHNCTIQPFTATLPEPTDPNWEQLLIDEIQKFNNPPESKVEKADVADERPR